MNYKIRNMIYKMFEEYDPENDNRTILAEFEDPDDIKYYYLLDENTKEVSFATKGKQAIKGFKDFLYKHPYMTGVAVSVGLSALDSYRSNKRMTTRFFATNEIERKLYRNVVADLKKTGNYTVLKDGRRLKGGWLWELKRKGIY